MVCAICGERDATVLELGRPTCTYCASLPEDPVEIAAFGIDEHAFGEMTVQ